MIFEQFKTSLPFDDQNYIHVEYPDYFFAAKNRKARVKDLGKKFAEINAFFYDYLQKYHIPTAYVKKSKTNTIIFSKFNELPFYVKILNSVNKRTAKLFGKKEGEQMELPIYEFHFGHNKDSLICESHLVAFDFCSTEDVRTVNRICSKVNAVLKAFFERRNERIVEVICSFGKQDNNIYLVDDFSPMSLKVFPEKEEKKWTNPYKLSTSNEMKKYTDYLYRIINS